MPSRASQVADLNEKIERCIAHGEAVNGAKLHAIMVRALEAGRAFSATLERYDRVRRIVQARRQASPRQPTPRPLSREDHRKKGSPD